MASFYVLICLFQGQFTHPKITTCPAVLIWPTDQTSGSRTVSIVRSLGLSDLVIMAIVKFKCNNWVKTRTFIVSWSGITLHSDVLHCSLHITGLYDRLRKLYESAEREGSCALKPIPCADASTRYIIYPICQSERGSSHVAFWITTVFGAQYKLFSKLSGSMLTWENHEKVLFIIPQLLDWK